MTFEDIKDEYDCIDKDDLSDALWAMANEFEPYEAAKSIISDIVTCETVEEFKILNRFFVGIFGWSLETLLSRAKGVDRECIEPCPNCGHENVYVNYDPVANGYKAICQECGQEIMLCDECLHADGNEGDSSICDWHGTHKNGKCYGKCFRGETVNPA